MTSIGRNLIDATSVGGYVLQGVGSFNSVGDIFVANKCFDIEVNSGLIGACSDAPAAQGNTSHNVVVTGDRFQFSTTSGYYDAGQQHIRILTPLDSSSITSNSFSQSHNSDIYMGAHGKVTGLTISGGNQFLDTASSSVVNLYADGTDAFGFEIKNNTWVNPGCWAVDSIIPSDIEGNYISHPFTNLSNCGTITPGEGGAIILAGSVGNSTLRNNRTDSASYAATAVAGATGTVFISSSGNRAPNFPYDAIFNQGLNSGSAPAASSLDERVHNYAGAGAAVFTTMTDPSTGNASFTGNLTVGGDLIARDIPGVEYHVSKYASIQAAINAAYNNGAVLGTVVDDRTAPYSGPGFILYDSVTLKLAATTYTITSTVTYNNGNNNVTAGIIAVPGAKLIGASTSTNHGTIITAGNGLNADLIATSTVGTGTGAAAQWWHWGGFENLRVIGNGANQTAGNCFNIENMGETAFLRTIEVSGCKVDNILFTGASATPSDIANITTNSAGRYGFNFNNLAGVAVVHGLSGDSNTTSLVRLNGGQSGTLTILGFKTEEEISGQDPLITIDQTGQSDGAAQLVHRRRLHLWPQRRERCH